jgi:hypothetical protein
MTTPTPNDFRELCAELVDIATAHCNPDDFAVGDCAAVLTRARTALARTEPQWATDEEIDALVICIQGLPVPDADDLALPSIDRGRDMVRKALARWGRPAIKPVPVAERLPGPEDCDAEGRCWWLTLAVADGGRGGYSTFWELTTFKAAVRCASHWLPHHALPVPTAP